MVYLHHGENELIMPKYRVKSIFLSNLLSTKDKSKRIFCQIST